MSKFNYEECVNKHGAFASTLPLSIIPISHPSYPAACDPAYLVIFFETG